MEMTHQNKRLAFIVAMAVGLLFVPLIAMLFTNEVNWNLFDFIVAGVLLVGTGLVFELILRTTRRLRYRLLFGIALFALLFLIWAELAVGLFGTPFAGS